MWLLLILFKQKRGELTFDSSSFFLFFFAGEPQEECARCGKTFLMLVGGGGSQVGSDVTGLCNDCSGGDPITDNDKEELEEDSDAGGISDVSADGDVDVDNEHD